MALITYDYCLKHGEQQYINKKCQSCRQEELDKEEERWESLTLRERINELKERLDNLKSN